MLFYIVTQQDLNLNSDVKIQRHPTFHTDVSDSNQSTECRQQNISIAVNYSTLWSRKSNSCSGGYLTLLCRIGIVFLTRVVAVIRHFPVRSLMSKNQIQVGYPTHKSRISDGPYIYIFYKVYMILNFMVPYFQQ